MASDNTDQIMKKVRILLVEDESIVALETESTLKEMGYEVISIVETGAKALEVTNNENPDIILMDILIRGDMDSIATAEKIRTRFGIPIIFLTAFLDEKRLEKAKVTMPFGYVLKPVQERDLKVAIEMTLHVSKVDAQRSIIEQELKYSETTLRNIVEHSTNLFYTHTPEHLITYISPQCKDILGYEPEAAKINWVDLASDHPVNQSGYQITKKAIDTGIRQPPYELELKHKNGEKVWLEIRESPVVVNGRTVSIVGSATDITAQKKVVQSLKDSKENYKSFIEKSPVAIVVVRDDMKVIYANQLALRISEYSKEEIIKLSIVDLIAPFDKEEAISKWSRKEENTNPEKSFEIAVITKTKKILTAKIFYVDLTWEGEPAYLYFLNDVTERRKAELALKSSEDELRSIVGALPDITFIISSRGQYLKVLTSKESARLLYNKSSELEGKYVKDVLPQKQARQFQETIDQTLTSNNQQILNYSLPIDGKEIYFEGRTSPMKSVDSVVWVARDITERVKAEQELRKSEEKFRTVIEQMNEGLTISNEDFELDYVNKIICETLGYSEEELVGHAVNHLFTEESLNLLLAHREKLQKGEISSCEVDIIKKDGTILSALLSSTPILENGKFTKSIAIFTDITILKQQEKLLEQKVSERTKELVIAREEAETANRLKSEFLANISHELRTPMHSILSYSDFGFKNFDRKDSERLIEYFKNINMSGIRLMNLLNDLLDLSKLQANKMEYQKFKWSIKSVFNDIKTEFSILATEKNLSWQIQEIENADVAFDAERIKQVISNLFSNAIKYSDENSAIEVCFENTSNEFFITITNEGVSIPTDELESIFDPFIQSSTTKTGAGGTGLGLPICKRIIEDHGGKIWAEENPNGATIKFYLIKE